jgi:hypothetical protein
MNTLEDRLRDALRERADHSPVSSDAWERVLTRVRRRRAFRLGGHAWHARYVIPALAAAAVAGVIIAANVIAGQLPSPSATPGAGTTPSAVPTSVAWQLGLARSLAQQVPPTSAVLAYQDSPEGTGVYAVFWLGHRSQSLWFDNVDPGIQLCSVMSSNNAIEQPEYGTASPERPATLGNGTGFCQAAPQLAAGQVVRVTEGTSVGGNPSALAALSARSGIAAAPVASVTAVLPDGRTFAGVVGTGRGFTDKVWSVAYPPDGAVRLVFRDSSGRVLASLNRPGSPAFIGPPRAARPGSGAVIFLVPGGTIRAYLVDGHIGFWTLPSGWSAYAPAPETVVISGYTEPGGPALAGIIVPGEFVGYARAGVAKVVVRAQNIHGFAKLTTFTVRTNWPGTSVRLWHVAMPAGTVINTSLDTATAYNAAGQVVAVIHLDREESFA